MTVLANVEKDEHVHRLGAANEMTSPESERRE
jgi:hypothetical protein